jgi:hypothetical protein
MVITSVAKGDLGCSVAHALRDTVEGKPPEMAVRFAICALRDTSYTPAQFLEECASAKDEVLGHIDSSDQILKAWQFIDSVAAVALRETSCTRETVLKTFVRGNAEAPQACPGTFDCSRAQSHQTRSYREHAAKVSAMDHCAQLP